MNLLTRDNQLQVDVYLTGKKVRDLMSTDLLTCSLQTTVQEVAVQMKRRGVGSIVILDTHGKPAGILTDADLRSKILAEGCDPSTSVRRVIENEMAGQGYGPPPVPYCWLAMGSEGRQE